MQFYSVHVQTGRDLVLVKEGFSWPGFLFGILWLLWHGMGLVFFALVVAGGLVLAAVDFFDLPTAAGPAMALVLAVAFGFFANDLLRWTLRKRGYRDEGVIGGNGREAAAQRYLDLNPRSRGELRT